jgi:lipoprotein-anchoring transpeptidase ErfK/SrfK
MTKFRHLIWMMTAAFGLMLSAQQSYAQKPDVGDQPGLIADDSVELDPEYRKQVVYYRTNEAPGTIIISTAERHLYLVQGNGRAMRYGIGVGRDGFTWQGLVNITVYRIHGTNRPDTIGTAVSSGCFRLVNADVADLYERVPVGTKVIIRQKPEL